MLGAHVATLTSRAVKIRSSTEKREGQSHCFGDAVAPKRLLYVSATKSNDYVCIQQSRRHANRMGDAEREKVVLQCWRAGLVGLGRLLPCPVLCALRWRMCVLITPAQPSTEERSNSRKCSRGKCQVSLCPEQPIGLGQQLEHCYKRTPKSSYPYTTFYHAVT